MINKIYLKEENMGKLRKIFNLNRELRSIKMEKFFDKQDFNKIKKSILQSRFIKKEKPMHYKYSISKNKNFNKALNSKSMKNLISKITGKKIRKINGNICCFGWKDYTLLHDDAIEKPGFDIIFDFNEYWNSDSGGIVAYSDNHGNSNAIEPGCNTLIIVKRKKGVKKFVKYLNNLAGKRKRMLYFGNLI